LPCDGDPQQPPTLPPDDEQRINPAKIESNLAAEFARASHKGPALAPRIGAARFSCRVLILFSGPYARPDGLVAFLQRLGLEVVPVDNDPNGGDRTHDILDNEFYSSLLRRSQRGEFIAIWAAPPCSSFSICRFLPTRTPGGGPPIVRRRQEGQVTGARDIPPKNKREVKISNEIISRTLAILKAGFDAGSECGLENPVDAGDKDRPEHLVNCGHAPLWLMPEGISFKSYANCRAVTFPQCAFGAAFKKMTTFLLTPALGHILGDLNGLRCTHTHHEQRAGGERDAQGVWNSKAAAAYPPISIGPWQAPSTLSSMIQKLEASNVSGRFGHQQRKSYKPPTPPYVHRRRPPTRRRSRRPATHQTSLRASTPQQPSRLPNQLSRRQLPHP